MEALLNGMHSTKLSANQTGKVLYAGMIFFSPTANKNDELSFLKNRLGLYEFSIRL